MLFNAMHIYAMLGFLPIVLARNPLAKGFLLGLQVGCCLALFTH